MQQTITQTVRVLRPKYLRSIEKLTLLNNLELINQRDIELVT